jgi:hypothetical protein
MLTKDEARRIAVNIAKAAGAVAAAQFLTRNYLRHRGIRNYRAVGLVSNHRSGGCDSDSKGQK